MQIMKKILPAIVLLTIYICFPAIIIHAESEPGYSLDVVINETNFPDENFRNYIISEFDRNRDGIIPEWDIESITSIQCASKQIRNLKGIEYFTSLQVLDCSDNQLAGLDISHNTELLSLRCFNNQLNALDIKRNTLLKDLVCFSNNFTELDIVANEPLLYTYHYGRRTETDEGVEYYDGGSCYFLVDKDVHFITELEINEDVFPDNTFRNYVKESFDVNWDGLLDDYEIYNIRRISCPSRYIQTLEGIEYFTQLRELDCSDNLLESLDLNGNRLLTEFDCHSNRLSGDLDLRMKSSLVSVNCSDNQLDNLLVYGDSGLKSLDCSENRLPGVYASHIPGLVSFDCSDNKIDYLFLANNDRLANLDCSNNKLEILDLKENTTLVTLNCSDNQLTGLTLPQNLPLTTLDCSNNQLTNLNLYSCPELTTLICNDNYLKELVFQNNTKLAFCDCSNNHLYLLDTSMNKALTYLNCVNNYLEELKILYSPYLVDVYLSGQETVYDTTVVYSLYNDEELAFDKNVRIYSSEDELFSVDITDKVFPDDKFRDYITLTFDKDGNGNILKSELDSITSIDCSSKGIEDLTGIDCFSELTLLKCSGNRLKNLSYIRKNEKLVTLYCYNNQLSSIDIRNNTKLEKLYCADNGLESLDLSNNPALKELSCSNNRLGSLDLSNNPELTIISCSGNLLDSLNVEKNTKLIKLQCYENQLESLIVGRNTSLEQIYCDGNQLSSLDISKNLKLKELYCDNNQLTKLDIRNNLKLVDAYKNGTRTVGSTSIKYKSEQGMLQYDRSVKIDAEEVVPQPLKITLSNVAGGVKISWKAESEAVKYRVYKKDTKGKFAKLDTVTTLKYTDASVTAGETATYSVVALSSAGKELNITGTGTKITYIAPAITTTVKYKATGTAISWKALNGAAKYRVFRKAGSGDWAKLTTTTSLSFVDKTAVYGKKYTYAVRAMSSGGSFVSAMGEGTSFTYQAPALKLTLANTNTGVKISWTTVSGVSKYRVYVKNTSGAWVKLATVKEGTTYTDTSAKNGKSYTYAVCGLDSSGRLMNEYGEGYTIHREKPAMAITLKSVAAGVKVSWKAYDGAGKYRVYRKNSDGTWTMISTIKVSDNVLFYRDTTAEDGKKYTYTVIAMTSGGSALTGYGEGQSIKYVKPVSEAEVVEAEVTDADGNIVVYKITEDEITEDYVEIVTEDSEEVSEDVGEDIIEDSEAAEAEMEETKAGTEDIDVISEEPEEVESINIEDDSEDIGEELEETKDSLKEKNNHIEETEVITDISVDPEESPEDVNKEILNDDEILDKTA